MSAKFIEQQETPRGLERKAVDATFLHNGTYLICDSSVWNIDSSIINCIGNVRLIQGETELTSEKLDYLIDLDLAQFRGALVQLRNKQENILRTRVLDYNTRDSVAVFTGGASMKSENGQIIESDEGEYYNASELFFFNGNVNMYTDSVFVKTNSLKYDSAAEKAWFTSYIDFWKEDNMLSADGGWYESGPETFFFEGDVHALSEEQESWSDSLYYFRNSGDVLMLGSAQLQDTTRSVAAVSDYLFYEDSLSRVTLRKQAAVAMWSETDGQIDTTWFGADTLVYQGIRHCDIPEEEITLAAGRLDAILGDPVAEYRRRAAEEAAAAAKKESDAKNSRTPGARSQPARQATAAPVSAQGAASGAAKEGQADPSTETVAADSLKLGAAADSLKLSAAADSLALASAADSLLLAAGDSLAVADSLVAPPDTSRIGHLTGIGNVRIFRRDMQVRSDSVRFSELDSIARFYHNPIVWNEGNRQYTSDSLFVLVRDNAVDRANLMSNAFIAVREDSVHYDQIRSAEIMAYFDADAALRRFDALGGVSALFYLEENDELATVNKVESTMLSATMSEGELQTVYYFESPKSDAYPIVQLPPADAVLRGFSWQPDLRPESPESITTLTVRPSERRHYEAIERPVFEQTRFYFTGFMDELYAELEAAVQRKRMKERQRRLDEQRQAEADSLAMVDSLGVRSDSLAIADSLALSDSLAVADSLAAAAPEEEYMSERELRRALRIARRDARWAELDARDAARDAEKARRAEEKIRRREERQFRLQARQAARDLRLLQKYIERYQNQKARDERQQESKPAGERPPGIEAGGELPAPPES